MRLILKLFLPLTLQLFNQSAHGSPKEVIEIICTEFTDEGVESGTLWRVLQVSTEGNDYGRNVTMDGDYLLYSSEFDFDTSPEFPAQLTSFSGTLGGPSPDLAKLSEIFKTQSPQKLYNLNGDEVEMLSGLLYRNIQREFSFYVGVSKKDRIIFNMNEAIPSEPWGYFGSVRRYDGNEISDPIFGGILNCLEARTIPKE